MLNDRERRVLARIEQQLRTSDPEFARLFEPRLSEPRRSEHGVGHRGSGVTPRFLLVVGLLLMVLGSAVVVVPIAVFGMLLSAAALVLAAQHAIAQHGTGGARGLGAT